MYAEKKINKKVQELRVQYQEIIKNILVENLIFINEAEVNMAIVGLYTQ